MKTVYVVYQDCALCGQKGEKIKKFASEKEIELVKLGFTTEKAKKYIKEAVFKHGIGSMPFFTDGTKYSYRLSDLTDKTPEKVEKKATKAKKVRKTKKGKVNEPVQEN